MPFAVDIWKSILVIVLLSSQQQPQEIWAEQRGSTFKSQVFVNTTSILMAQTSAADESDLLAGITQLGKKVEDLRRQLTEARQAAQDAEQRRLKIEDQMAETQRTLEAERQQSNVDRQQLLDQQQKREQELQRQLDEARQATQDAEQRRLQVEEERASLEEQLVAEKNALEAERLSKTTVTPPQDMETRRQNVGTERGQAIVPGVEETRSRQQQEPPSLAREIVGKDGARLVLVPAGEFTMGSDVRENEKPRHQVRLDAYYMNINEVTTSRYARFIVATGRPEPDYWKALNLPRHGERPVVGVTWEDAKAYCRWAGGRLPTEAQWEKAARGTDGRFYPWGDGEPTFQHANFGKATWSGYDTLEPVGKLEAGQSPYGIHDLAGNVWEWIADWYDPGYYRQSPSHNPTGPSTGTTKGMRGGSWDLQAHFLRSANRSGAVPTTRHYSIGFRCAQDTK